MPINVKAKKKIGMKTMLEINSRGMHTHRGYEKFESNDWIMISDIDEIPDPKRLENLM